VSRESVSATAARQETGAPWDRRPGPARVGIDASEITSGIIDPERLGTGTPSAANYLRGDGTWAAAGGGAGGTATVTVPNGRYEHEQVITAVGVTGSSRVTLSLGTMADSAENAADMLDVASIGAIPGTDQITVLLAFSAPTAGPIPINWSAA
jgi:hypothetical protein